MPELQRVIKQMILPSAVRITACQLTPEGHADGMWHGAGLRDGEKDLSDAAFLEPGSQEARSLAGPGRPRNQRRKRAGPAGGTTTALSWSTPAIAA